MATHFFCPASTGLRDVKWFPVLPLEWPVGLVVCVSMCVCIMVCICVYEVSVAARAGVILLPRYCSLTISLMTQRLRETLRNLNPLVRMYGSVCHRTSSRICALMVQVINSRNTMLAKERKHNKEKICKRKWEEWRRFNTHQAPVTNKKWKSIPQKNCYWKIYH